MSNRSRSQALSDEFACANCGWFAKPPIMVQGGLCLICLFLCPPPGAETMQRNESNESVKKDHPKLPHDESKNKAGESSNAPERSNKSGGKDTVRKDAKE